MPPKSQQKQTKRTQFFKNNILSHEGSHSSPISNLSFEMARLTVNEKLLYVKTCFQKKADYKDLFRFYPFKNLEGFKMPFEELVQQICSENIHQAQQNQTQENPQNSFTNKKTKIVKDENGIHLVENIDIVTEDEAKSNSQKTNVNNNRQLFNGLAISIFHNGSLFEGNYHDGKFCGQCLQINEDGDLFIGQFKDGSKKGFGAYYSFLAKEVYKGTWQNDLPHGSGTYSNSETTYQGNFSNGFRNGFGIQKFTNGDYYAGEYINGTPEGYGEYYWADGSFYRGDFSHGARHGYGIWEDQSQTYFGSYRMDNKEGFGVYTWKNRKVYKGQFRDDYRQGYGEMYSINRLTKKPKLVYKGAFQKGTKQPQIQVSQQAIEELNYFLEKQNQLIAQIPKKKQRVGHKNCIPHQQGCHGHRH